MSGLSHCRASARRSRPARVAAVSAGGDGWALNRSTRRSSRRWRHSERRTVTRRRPMRSRSTRSHGRINRRGTVDPPRVHVEGYVGGAQNVTGMFAIWLSREAGDHATAAAGRLTGDLGRVAAVLVRAELGDDVNVHEAFTLDTQPRRSGRGDGDRRAAAVGGLGRRMKPLSAPRQKRYGRGSTGRSEPRGLRTKARSRFADGAVQAILAQDASLLRARFPLACKFWVVPAPRVWRRSSVRRAWRTSSLRPNG